MFLSPEVDLVAEFRKVGLKYNCFKKNTEIANNHSSLKKNDEILPNFACINEIAKKNIQYSWKT